MLQCIEQTGTIVCLTQCHSKSSLFNPLFPTPQKTVNTSALHSPNISSYYTKPGLIRIVSD